MSVVGSIQVVANKAKLMTTCHRHPLTSFLVTPLGKRRGFLLVPPPATPPPHTARPRSTFATCTQGAVSNCVDTLFFSTRSRVVLLRGFAQFASLRSVCPLGISANVVSEPEVVFLSNARISRPAKRRQCVHRVVVLT